MARLEPHRRRRPDKAIMVEAPERQVAVDRGALEPAGRRLHEPVGRLDAVPLEQLDGAPRGKSAPLAVLAPQLERRHQLAVALEGLDRDRAGPATIGAMGRPWPEKPLQQAVERRPADAVELGRALHQPRALRVPRRQPVQPPPEIHEHLGSDALSHGRGSPANGSNVGGPKQCRRPAAGAAT